jgi:xylulose-5-phosphate/fructose-6-phosphate phosphoketolase
MVMLNDLDRFRLVMDVIDRVPGLAARYAGLRQRMADARIAARAYTREHGQDDPAISGWAWPYHRDGSPRALSGAAAPVDTGDDNVSSQSAGGEDAMAASG